MQDSITSGSSGGASPVPPDSGARSRPDMVPAGGQAPSLAGQARQTLTGALDDRKNAAADLLDDLAHTVHRSGEQFGGQDWITSAIERGAAELHSLAGSLRDQDVGDLMTQVQSLARRRPALFVGAALAAGFAVARLGKVTAGDLSRDDLPTLREAGHGQH